MGKRNYEDLRPPGAKELQREADKDFETQVTNWFCAHYKIGKEVRQELIDAQEEQHGNRQLRLVSWCQELGYPMTLSVGQVTKLQRKATIAQLLTRFSQSRLYQEYRELADCHEGEVGLIFPWPRMNLNAPPGATNALVLHNRYPRIDSPGSRLVWKENWAGEELSEGDEQLTLQAMVLLVNDIDEDYPRHRWRPGQ